MLIAVCLEAVFVKLWVTTNNRLHTTALRIYIYINDFESYLMCCGVMLLLLIIYCIYIYYIYHICIICMHIIYINIYRCICKYIYIYLHIHLYIFMYIMCIHIIHI